MLKRNFIAIIVFCFVLTMSVGSFGQTKPRKGGKTETGASKISTPRTKNGQRTSSSRSKATFSDFVFLRNKNLNNKNPELNLRKPRKSFSSQTRPFADGLVVEKRRKTKGKQKAQNLLPYIEQSNLSKKGARGK